MSERRIIHRAVIALVCGTVIAMLAGCKSYEGQQAKVAQKAVTSLSKTRVELAKTDQEVSQMLASMDQLQSEPRDLRQAYKAFTSEASDTTKQAEKTHKQAEKMQDQWRTYIGDWERSIDQIRSPEVRAGATDRRQTVREEYNQVRDVAREFEEAYEPFSRDLRDLQRTLELDLTNQGVATAKPGFEATRQSGEKLRQRIDAFIAQLDKTIAQRTMVNTGTQQATEY